MRGTKEYALAMKIVNLEDALNIANKNARKDGKLGVLPNCGGPSFREANKFHARVRQILKEIY